MVRESAASPTLRGRILSGSLWAVSGRIFWIPLGLALNAILARLLTPTELGVYFLATSLLLAGRAIAEMGVGTAATRLVAEALAKDEVHRARGAVRKSLGLSAAGGLGVALVYVLGAPALAAGFGTAGLRDVTPWIAGLLIGETVSFAVGECIRGYGDIRSATIFQGVLARTVLLAGVGSMWFAGEGSLDGVLALLLAATLASSAIAAVLAELKGVARSKTVPADASRAPAARELLSIGAPLMGTTLLVMLRSQFDLWLVGSIHAEEELAIYGTASRLAAFIVLPQQAVIGVLSPMITELHTLGRTAELERVLRSTATLATLPAALGVLVCAVFGEDLLGLVFGATYARGAPILLALALGWLVIVWTGVCGQALQMTGHQRLVMLLSLAIVIPTCVVAFVLAPVLSLNGIAYVVAAGTALHAVATLWAAHQRLGIWAHATLRPKM